MKRRIVLVSAIGGFLSVIFFLACGGGAAATRQSSDDDTSPAVDDDGWPAGDDDNDDDNDNDDVAGLDWIPIPAGSFEMGCVPQDPACQPPLYPDERPRHLVTLSAFQMTKTDVTQSQYEQVMGNNPSYFTSCGPDCPVERVTWFDARAFCDAVGGRLPTEAEWEYTARAGTTTIFYCGDDPTCMDEIAWTSDNSQETTHAVCRKSANAWGLCDMFGDVQAWLGDWYSIDYYSVSPTNDPQGPDTGIARAVRGVAWDFGYPATRASARDCCGPDDVLEDLGFRCVREFN